MDHNTAAMVLVQRGAERASSILAWSTPLTIDVAIALQDSAVDCEFEPFRAHYPCATSGSEWRILVKVEPNIYRCKENCYAIYPFPP